MEVFAGDIVYAKAGRDKDKPFVVLSVLSSDSDYAMLADGRCRRVDQPKKKKIKHPLKSGHSSAYIAEKLAEGVKVTNPDLKKVLAEFLNEHDV